MIIKLLKTAIYSSIFLAICFIVTIIYFLNLLPNYESLENYKPNVMSRVHAADGKLIREFSREYRIFIPIEDIPENVKLAFIAAEDGIRELVRARGLGEVYKRQVSFHCS